MTLHDSHVKSLLITPPEGNVLMFWLLSGGVKDTLPTVDLHTDIKFKVNVSFSSRTTEATAGGCARPALAEQLTHSGEPRGLSVRGLTEEKRRKGMFSECCRLPSFTYSRENKS